MKKYSVSVVIPNYNGSELLLKNLPALLSAKNNKKNNINEIIVVDDGSTDDSINSLKSFGAQLKIIRHKINRGFSASVNIGVRYAKSDLVLLLNTDILVNENFLVNVFENFLNNKLFSISLGEIGYGASRGYFSNGFVQLGNFSSNNKVRDTFYVSGGSGLYRKSIWNDLGGMDEKLLSPFYWEDLDLSYRAWKQGYTNLWDPSSKLIHKHESTISKFPKNKVNNIRERNQLLVIWKNIHSLNMIKSHLYNMLLRAIKHPGYLKIIFMALFKIGTVLKSRQKEIKLSLLSDEAVFEKFHE